MHATESKDPNNSNTVTQAGFTWKVTVAKDAAKAKLTGKSKRALEREAIQKYITEKLTK